VSQQLPQDTLETLARSFFKEAMSYGFAQVDYIRFVNLLLDLAIRNGRQQRSSEALADAVSKAPMSGGGDVTLPCCGQRVCVRAFNSQHDKSLMQDWLHDEYGRHFLLSCTTAEVENCEKLAADEANIFGIITLRDGTPIGAIAFLGICTTQRKAELRKLIGVPSMRGQGLAKEATALWIDYGISTLKLNKIYLHTLDTHLRNIKLNESLGFKVEGILRNEVLIDGTFRDVLRMGLCRDL
jgi:RimJ/RimL family protein N-acetyltransferase